MDILLKGIASALISAAALLGWHQPMQNNFGASFTPVGGTTFYLSGAGITSSQSTMQLTSFLTPDGRPLVMSMFGQIGYGALEPGTSKLEDITFTGIVQNSNGTATLTGVARGIDFVSPYAASSTLAKAHAGGSTFILTNTAAFYGQQFLFANNIGTSTAILTFSSTTPPRLDSVAAQGGGSPIATTSEFATVAYVNTTSASGAPNATTAVKGIVQLATAAQQASSTSLGGTGASLVIQAGNATDTPQSKCNSLGSAGGAGCAIIADLGGHIKQAWINLSEAFTFAGNVIFSALATFNGVATFNANVAFTSTTTGLDWQLLYSTTTTANMAFATTTIPSTKTNLRIIVYIAGFTSSPGLPYLQFNTDGNGATSYGYNVSTTGTTSPYVLSSGNTAQLALTSTSTTSPSSYEINVYNAASTAKQIRWSGMVQGGANAGIPAHIEGAGTWATTTAQMSTFVLQAQAGTLTSGTKIYVYGSQ